MALVPVDIEKWGEDDTDAVYRRYFRWGKCPRGSLSTDRPSLGSQMPSIFGDQAGSFGAVLESCPIDYSHPENSQSHTVFKLTYVTFKARA